MGRRAWIPSVLAAILLVSSPAAAQNAARATLAVSTGTDTDATVTIESGGERWTCATPCRADVPAGHASVTTVRGGRSATSSVDLPAGESTMQVLPPGGDLLAGVLWLIAWAELEVLGFGLSFTHLRTDTGWVFVGNAIGGLAPILATPAITQIMRYALSGAVEVRPGISALVSMRWSITPGGVGLALSF